MPKKTVVRGQVWKHTPGPEDPNGGVTPSTRTPFEPTVPLAEGERIEVEPSLELSWSTDEPKVEISLSVSRDHWIDTARDLDANADVQSKSVAANSMNREQINELIRALREARDAAFGTDE